MFEHLLHDTREEQVHVRIRGVRAAVPGPGHGKEDEADVTDVERAEDHGEDVPELSATSAQIQRASQQWKEHIVRDVAEMEVFDEWAPRQIFAQRDSRPPEERLVDCGNRPVVVSRANQSVETTDFRVEERQHEDGQPVAECIDPFDVAANAVSQTQ